MADISLFQHVIYEALSSVLDSFNVAKIRIKSGSAKFPREKSGNFLFFKKLTLSLATPKIPPLEKTQKIFGFLLAYSYLCTRRFVHLWFTTMNPFNHLSPTIRENREAFMLCHGRVRTLWSSHGYLSHRSRHTQVPTP